MLILYPKIKALLSAFGLSVLALPTGSDHDSAIQPAVVGIALAADSPQPPPPRLKVQSLSGITASSWEYELPEPFGCTLSAIGDLTLDTKYKARLATFMRAMSIKEVVGEGMATVGFFRDGETGVDEDPVPGADDAAAFQPRLILSHRFDSNEL